MADNKQPVEAAGGLLSSIIKAFFGNIGKILDSAAEYEEEMGVMKQVTRVTLKSATGDDFTLTVKLSPVRNKDGKFYVEVETDAPNFDISSLNGRVVDLNKNNIQSFNNLVTQLIEKNGYDWEAKEGDASTSKKSEQGPSRKEEEQQEQELEKEIKALNYRAKIPDGATDEQGNRIDRDVLIHVDVDIDYKENCCYLTMSVTDEDGVDIGEYTHDTYEIKDASELVDNHTRFLAEAQEAIDDYAKSNNIIQNRSSTIASTVIDAQFIKSSTTGDIELTAVTASCNIRAALDVIQDIAESDEFESMIGDEPTSLRITEEDDGYTLDEIDEVDTSNSYCDMFKEVCIANSSLNTYQWALGFADWNSDPFLSSCQYPISSLLDNCAVWVIKHTDKFPNVIGTFGNDCTDLEDFKDKDGVSMQKVHDSAKALLEGLLEILDIYYVNLDHEEQKAVDDFMNEANRLLAYA